MKLTVDLGIRSYDIIIKRGVLAHVGMLVPLTGKVLVVTDDGVPPKIVREITSRCAEVHTVVLASGGEKTMDTCREVLCTLQEKGFSKSDVVVAVGGGTPCDVAGFAAAVYLYGVPYYLFPTTTMAQMDAAIGGRTGFNLCGTAGNTGTIFQPQLVAADPDVLQTLPKRHYNSGLASALRYGLVGCRELFEMLENGMEEDAAIERMLYLCARTKKALVEQDECVQKDGRLMDFGSLVGTATQVGDSKKELLYGECLALGMLPLIENRTLLRRTKAVMKKLGLPVVNPVAPQMLTECINMAPARVGGKIMLARVKTLGEGYIDTIEPEELELLLC